MASYGGDLIREARRRAGLTQQELASSAGTAQPGIARWESGRTAVSLDDVMRLVRLCGLDLELHIVARDGSDIVQAERLAHLTGQQRLDRHARVTRQLRDIREQQYGQPTQRSPQTTRSSSTLPP
ncbi:helix-turn-helix transcriptional regulator [Mycolicibacterium tusciae]|uniref:helix-turn-helix transcriptional regulator n=1 Tax=Mycolicibacterium tusciae TaxID=75922 RepID=UPI00024A1F4E|nr:helix-turn-helix transcriptional regulator [Mycolicibacterium tusciae]